MLKAYRKIIIALFFLFVPSVFVLADSGGQRTNFFINSGYDLQKRSQTTAVLIRITPSLYFYLDEVWWNSLPPSDQSAVKASLQSLGEEFDETIYPKLTEAFGSEWRPGVDRDFHITVLFHPMDGGQAGYVDTGNEYIRQQNNLSNEREMVYLNTAFLTSPLAKSYLAHEFTHLIAFNQKEMKFGVSEAVWLNEARAEYAITLLGYDNDYQNSNLKKRVKVFLQYPNDSLIGWQNSQGDYGVLNLFTQYLVENYGLKILTDSLKSSKTGIVSLQEALSSAGAKESFSQIFANWTAAVSVNDCSLGQKYCYKNPNLKDLKVVPQLNYLPLSAESSLAITQEIQDWSARWYKIIGGMGNLNVDFAGFQTPSFKVFYIKQDKQGNKSLVLAGTDVLQSGRIQIDNFGTNSVSLVIVPSLSVAGADALKEIKSYPFFLSALIDGKNPSQNSQGQTTEDLNLLIKKIEFLEKQLALLKTELKEASKGSGGTGSQEPGTLPTVLYLTGNLRKGAQGNQVKLLQTWLSRDASVYPEGIASGYFGTLTEKAVVRFQEKYSADVLIPFGLTFGNGFVGVKTREKLNELYGK